MTALLPQTGGRTDEDGGTIRVASEAGRRRRLVSIGSKVAIGIAAVVVAVIMLVPMYLVTVNAFKPLDSIIQNPFGIPLTELTFDNVEAALLRSRTSVLRSYAVTGMFVILVCALSVMLSAPTAYVIARGNSLAHKLLLILFVAAMFVPTQVRLIPAIYLLRSTHLMGTIPGFVLYETTLTMPMSIFLYTAYIRSIPVDLDHAAAIDGAGRIRTFWLIVFPLMRPAVATATIVHAFMVWNDWLNPQIILGSGTNLYTVTTGVYAAISQYTTDYSVVFSTILLAMAPALVFFVFMQRHIVKGLTSGGLKG